MHIPDYATYININNHPTIRYKSQKCNDHLLFSYMFIASVMSTKKDNFRASSFLETFAES